MIQVGQVRITKWGSKFIVNESIKNTDRWVVHWLNTNGWHKLELTTHEIISIGELVETT